MIKIEQINLFFAAIVNIAKENNITVLAEGIETKEEYLYLKDNGASLVQGYYFAKAIFGAN